MAMIYDDPFFKHNPTCKLESIIDNYLRIFIILGFKDVNNIDVSYARVVDRFRKDDKCYIITHYELWYTGIPYKDIKAASIESTDYNY